MKKIKDYLIKKEIVQKMMMLFLIVQPLLDIYILFDEKVVSFFGFSPSTIIRFIFVFVLFGLFLTVRWKKKEIILYSVFIVLLGIYTLFHHINAINFTDFYNGYDFGYNLVGELFYICRMILPLIMIIVSSHYNYNESKIEKIINILLLLICGSIIISNILVISTGSYSKEIIKGSIVCWFKANRCGLNYLDLASKGFFLDPNRLSALLILLSSIMMMNIIKNTSVKNMIVFIVTDVGMLMLGTKVSTFGFLGLCLSTIILYLFFTFIKKDLKFCLKTFIFLIVLTFITVLILPKVPAVNRTAVDSTLALEYETNANGNKELNEKKIDEINEKIKKKYKKDHLDSKEEKSIDEMLKEMNKDDRNELLANFVFENYRNYGLHEHFVLDSYPYQYDPEFWYNIMQMDYYDRVNFRKIEYLMLTRVKEINNNPKDDWLGISFVREGNIFDLERDYISQYLTMGIIGVILLISPYIITILTCTVKMLLHFKELFTVQNAYYLLGPGICLSAAFFTGNVLDGLIVTLILGFFIGQLINSIYTKNRG